MDIDNEIIRLLKENSRYTNQHIARLLDVSEGTIRNKIKKLVEEKRIIRFTIKTPSTASALCMIKTDTSSKTEDIIKDIIKNPYISEIYEISGDYSILCKIESKNMNSLNDAVEDIRGIKGVINTKTHTILNEI